MLGSPDVGAYISNLLASNRNRLWGPLSICSEFTMLIGHDAQLQTHGDDIGALRRSARILPLTSPDKQCRDPVFGRTLANRLQIMSSSIEATGQRTYDEEESPISAEHLDGASLSTSAARLPSNQRSETPVLSDVQMQNTSKIEIEGKSTEREREEVEGQQQKERHEDLSEIRKKLEERTGFASYKAYLESLSCDPLYAGHSYINIIDTCFGEAYPGEDHNERPPLVDIVDVSDEGRSGGGVSLRCEHLSASEISVALCHPPPNTRAQVVLWPIRDYARGDIEDFLNVLGVGLELDPWFFETLRWNEGESLFAETFRSKAGLRIDSIGTSVFIARSFVLSQHVPVPVVLIAGPMHHGFNMFNRRRRGNEPFDPTSINKAIYDLVQAAPLYSPYSHGGTPHLANMYTRALFTLLKSSGGSALSPPDTLSACVIPLLQIEIAICRCSLDQLRGLFHGMHKDDNCEFTTRYRGCYRKGSQAGLLDGGTDENGVLCGETTESLYHYRAKLRSWAEYFDSEKRALIGFLSSLGGPHFTGKVSNSQIIEEYTANVEEVRRLEAEIRDQLQLQSSRSALEESKRSIELTNHQLYESKRVKIFTVLAFFYIPLNLATSVFGMNLQQLNGSGTAIGAFLGTAAVLLFVTGMTWLVFQGVQDALIVFRPSAVDILPVPRRKPNIFLRLGLIWLLCRNGLCVWTIRTGAGWCLLTNSSKGFYSKSRAFSDRNGLAASQFVIDIAPYIRGWISALNTDRGGWLSRQQANKDASPAGP